MGPNANLMFTTFELKKRCRNRLFSPAWTCTRSHYPLLLPTVVSVHLPSCPKRLQHNRFLLPRGELQFHIAHLPSLHFLLSGPDVVLMLVRVQLYVQQLPTRAILSLHQKVELA